MYIPIIAVALIMARRRLHDLDHSGWLALLLIVPLVNVFFGLYILFAAGTEGRNSYGPMPAKNSIALIIVGIILPLMFFGAMVATGVSGYLKYQEIAKAQKALQAKPTQ